MNARILKRLAATGAITAILVGSGGLAAFAKTTDTDFSGTANRLQQSRYFVTELKSNSNDSKIYFDYIGGGYKMNVKAQHTENGTQYDEKKGIGVTTTSSTILNATPAGDHTRLIVTNNSYAAVDVSISGAFRTN